MGPPARPCRVGGCNRPCSPAQNAHVLNAVCQTLLHRTRMHQWPGRVKDGQMRAIHLTICRPQDPLGRFLAPYPSLSLGTWVCRDATKNRGGAFPILRVSPPWIQVRTRIFRPLPRDKNRQCQVELGWCTRYVSYHLHVHRATYARGPRRMKILQQMVGFQWGADGSTPTRHQRFFPCPEEVGLEQDPGLRAESRIHALFEITPRLTFWPFFGA